VSTIARTLRRSPLTLAKADPQRAAKLANLVYVSDETPGITRKGAGKGFAYYAPGGTRITCKIERRRLNTLAVPPAYRDVWLCPLPDGHIQATGFDDRGRKQYRYHDRWHEVRDAAKYHHLSAFAEALPTIRRTVANHLRRKGLPREKVLAAVVRLMDKTGVRIGNDEYARDHGHYGATTLLNDHAEVRRGGRVTMNFVGKSGKEAEIDLTDAQLARVVEACQDLPGQELFGYEDDAGRPVDVTSQDVNEYLRDISGGPFTAKDFRTWAGTVAAAALLRDAPPADTVTARKKTVVEVVKQVAAGLNNTPAVCRKCYIHPAILTAYDAGQTIDAGTAADSLTADEVATVAALTG
jgi:DNA topoisomerase-1